MPIQSSLGARDVSPASDIDNLLNIADSSMLNMLFMLAWVSTSHTPLSVISTVTGAGTTPADLTSGTIKKNMDLLKGFGILVTDHADPTTNQLSTYTSPWENISAGTYLSIPETVQATIRKYIQETGNTSHSLFVYMDRLSSFVRFVAGFPHPVAQRDLLLQVSTLLRVELPDTHKLQRADIISKALSCCLASAPEPEARSLTTELVTTRMSMLGPHNLRTEEALFIQAQVASQFGHFDEAFHLASNTLKVLSSQPDSSASKRPGMIHLIDTLSFIHWGKGEHELACTRAAESVLLSGDELGDHHVLTVKRRFALAWKLAEGEMFNAAKTHLRAAVEARDRLPNATDYYSPFFPESLFQVEKMVEASIQRATPQDMQQALKLSGDVRQESKIRKHEIPQVYEKTTTLYGTILAQAQDSLGKTVLMRMRARQEEKYGQDNFQTIHLHKLLGDACVALGQTAEACEYYEMARHHYAHVEGHGSLHALAIVAPLVSCYVRLGKIAEARTRLYEAIELSATTIKRNDPIFIRLVVALSYFYTSLGFYEISLPVLDSANGIIDTMPEDFGYDLDLFRAEVTRAHNHLVQKRETHHSLQLQEPVRLDVELAENRAQRAFELVLGYQVTQQPAGGI